MKLHLFPVLVTSLLLTACGGGSGGGSSGGGSTANSSTPAPSSSKASSLPVSSSSAASSSAPELGCSYHEVAVYMNAACSPWQSPSVREKNADGSTGQEVDAKQSQALSLIELDTQDSAHQRVMDIHYNKTGAANSQLRFGIAGTSGLDLSTYQTGKLVFDIKVISKGDKNAPLQVTLECGWPCESTEKNIAISALNEWKTIELPIADFIRDGLDIKQVRSGFQIMPGLNQQANVHFQLDNIRWEKGQSPQPVAQSCYSHHFDSTAATGFNLKSFSGNKLPTIVGQVPASIIKPEWTSPQERWGYGEQTLTLDESCLGNPDSTFSASVYIPGAYVTDGKLLVGFYFADTDNKYTTAGLTSAANLVPDSWNIIQGKLPQTQRKTRAVSAKLAASNAAFAHWGILFDANGKDPAITGEVRIDNIVVSQSLVASSSSTSQNLSSAGSSSIIVSSSATSTSQSSSSATSSSPSSVAVSSSGSSLSSSSRLSSSKSSLRSSSVASSACTAGSGSHSGNATLGFGVSLNSFAFLRVELDNSTFIGSPNVSIANASLSIVMSNDSMVILQITPSQFLSSSTSISLSFDYQQQDAHLKVARSVGLYVSLSDAANRANTLFSSSTDIATPCSLSSRASSSQSSAIAASSLPHTSSHSSVISSVSSSVAVSSSSISLASSSAVASSIASSSSITSSSAISSVATSTASSQANSSAGCSTVSGSHSGNMALGFSVTSGVVFFLRIDLTNGELLAAPSASIPNASLTLVQSNNSQAIFQVTTNAPLNSATAVSVSVDYQQQNPGLTVSRSVTTYETLTMAVNQANALSGSSDIIDSHTCN